MTTFGQMFPEKPLEKKAQIAPGTRLIGWTLGKLIPRVGKRMEKRLLRIGAEKFMRRVARSPELVRSPLFWREFAQWQRRGALRGLSKLERERLWGVAWRRLAPEERAYILSTLKVPGKKQAPMFKFLREEQKALKELEKEIGKIEGVGKELKEVGGVGGAVSGAAGGVGGWKPWQIAAAAGVGGYLLGNRRERTPIIVG